MICKHCGRQIDDRMKFCTFCGAPTGGNRTGSVPEAQTKPCPRCGAQIGADKKFCPRCGIPQPPTEPADGRQCANCGAVNTHNMRYCTTCGAPLEERTMPESAGAWRCARCGTVNAPDKLYCVSCGTPQAEQFEPVDGWQCENCGAANAPDAPFCATCGTLQGQILEPYHRWNCRGCGKENEYMTRYCPICGTPRDREGHWLCSRCGAENVNRDVLCASCGAQNPDVHIDYPPSIFDEKQAENEPKKKNGIWALIVAATAVLAVIAVVMAVMLHRCELCGQVFLGEPYPLIRTVASKDETLQVCRDCYDAFGIPQEETPQPDGASSPAGPAAAPTTQRDSRISTLSAQDVRLVNLLLSNFSELGIENISSTQTEQIINFAVEHELINYHNAQTRPTDKQFIAWNADAGQNATYTVSVSEQFVQTRISRFFGGVTPNQTTGRFYHKDAQYFAVNDCRGAHPRFTSVYDFIENTDGTVTFFFKIFSAAQTGSDGFPLSEAYDGLAGDKDPANYTFVSAGKAHLKKADIGDNQAPYRVISIEAD